MKVIDLITSLQDFDQDSTLVFDVTGRLSRHNAGESVFVNNLNEVVISITNDDRAFGPTMKVKSPQQVHEYKQQVVEQRKQKAKVK